MKIGIFDSGVGGLAIAGPVWREFSGVEIFYIADKAFSPYGQLNEQQINERVLWCAQELERQQVDLIIIACNTATAAGVELIREKYNFPVIVSTHPRTKIKLESLNKSDINPLIQFLKPMGFFDYNKMQKNAYCVISDSGTISEESSILNFPAITIRQTHERPEGMDEGVLIMSGLKKERVLQSITIVVSQAKNLEHRLTKIVKDYDVNNFSIKIVRAIISYTDYINRTVWKK